MFSGPQLVKERLVGQVILQFFIILGILTLQLGNLICQPTDLLDLVLFSLRFILSTAPTEQGQQTIASLSWVETRGACMEGTQCDANIMPTLLKEEQSTHHQL